MTRGRTHSSARLNLRGEPRSVATFCDMENSDKKSFNGCSLVEAFA